jgi:hypothetical protein
LPHPPCSIASIPTYVPGMTPLRIPASTLADLRQNPWHSQRDAPVPTPGGVRLLNGVFPVSRSRQRRFRLRPRFLRIASPCLTARSSVHLPGELPVPCGTDSLPGQRGLPMSIHQCACGAGHSRVRYVLGGLWCPLQAARLSPLLPATFPSVRLPLLATIPYETLRSLFRFDPPAESSCDSSVSQPLLLTVVRSGNSIPFTLR